MSSAAAKCSPAKPTKKKLVKRRKRKQSGANRMPIGNPLASGAPIAVSFKSRQGRVQRSLAEGIITEAGSVQVQSIPIRETWKMGQMLLTFPLSPQSLGGRASSLAQNYDEYRFLRARISVVGSGGTGKIGAITFAVDPDPGDSHPYAGGIQGTEMINRMMANPYRETQTVWENGEISIPPSKWLYTDEESASQASARQTHSGIFALCANVPPDASGGALTVLVDWRIQFRKPSMPLINSGVSVIKLQVPPTKSLIIPDSQITDILDEVGESFERVSAPVAGHVKNAWIVGVTAQEAAADYRAIFLPPPEQGSVWAMPREVVLWKTGTECSVYRYCIMVVKQDAASAEGFHCVFCCKYSDGTGMVETSITNMFSVFENGDVFTLVGRAAGFIPQENFNLAQLMVQRLSLTDTSWANSPTGVLMPSAYYEACEIRRKRIMKRWQP